MSLSNFELIYSLIFPQESKTRMASKKKFSPADVTRSKETKKIILPVGMSYKQAIRWIEAKEQAEETVRSYSRDINFHPADVAVALSKEIEDRYGVSIGKGKPTFFGVDPPQMRSIPVSTTETVAAPWGRMTFPPLNEDVEFIETAARMKEDRVTFVCQGAIKEKNIPEIEGLMMAVEKRVREHSIYRGKAVRIEIKRHPSMGFYLADDCDPQFCETGVRPSDAMFEESVQSRLDASIYTPLRHFEATKRAGIPFGRGVLLAGKYGCGKTLTAGATATVAQESGITYIHLSDVRGLKAGLRFAEAYAPAVIFGEDIDRAMSGEERSAEMDAILNTLDGVDSKNRDVMVILTTNHPDRLNPAMLRPGRLDACIEIGPPDAATAARLLSRHSGLPVEECAKAGEIMAGHIPARLVEACNRAGLFALSISAGQTARLSSDALVQAAQAVVEESKIGGSGPPAETSQSKLGSAFESILRDNLSRSSVNGDYIIVEDQD